MCMSANKASLLEKLLAVKKFTVQKYRAKFRKNPIYLVFVLPEKNFPGKRVTLHTSWATTIGRKDRGDIAIVSDKDVTVHKGKKAVKAQQMDNDQAA